MARRRVTRDRVDRTNEPGTRVEDAYRRVHPRLWRALLAFCGDPEIAADAEADAFDQALRRGNDIRDVDAWIWRSAFKIASGLLADHRARHRPLDSATATATASEGLLLYDAPLVVFLSQLGELSDQQRAIVVLRHAGGFTPSEIAELIDSTPGSVRVQLHHAHTRLRRTMEAPDGR